MLKFTAMSCDKDGTKGISGFASVNVEINDFGAMKMQVSCFDAYESSFSRILSKLPILRNYAGLTDFRHRMDVALDNLINGGELIVGFYRRDVTVFNQLMRDMKKSNLNGGRVVLDINRTVREIIPELRKNVDIANSFDVAEAFNIDMTLVKELACIMFYADEYSEIPECAVRASLYCCIRVQEEGYDLEDLLYACTEFMCLITRAKEESEVCVNINKRVVA